MNAKAIESLAQYFTGPEVAHHSIALEVGGKMAERANRFFDAREAVGVTGWMDQEVAIRAIKLKVGDHG